jgi:hypothetical protein
MRALSIESSRLGAAMGFAAIALVAFTPSALAIRATTTPSTTLIVEVLITPKGVVVGKYADSATHDGFIPLGGPIPRGDFLNFKILNRRKKPVSFSMFGKKAAVKPGAIGHFNVLALTRGKFVYSSKIAGGKAVRCNMIVR